MRERLLRRPTAAAALLYAVLAFAMFAPGLAPGRTLSASDVLWSAVPWEASRPADVPPLGSNLDLQDAAVQFLPALQATRAALPHIPHWDPYTLGGRPFLGDPQSAVFSPFSVPSYVLPFWKSLAVAAMLKLFVAALGAFLLARALGMRPAGALMSGLVFGFSLWTVSWVSWPHDSVWVFLPWLCLLCELTVRRPGPLEFAGLAGVVGLQFLGGHPASSLQVLFVVVLFWIGRVLASPELRPRAATRLLTLAAGVVVGAALAAVALVPFAELLRHSSDATARADASALLKQPTRSLLTLFLPDYWGHGRTALQLGGGLEERAYYVAALPLMLGAAALAIRPSALRIAVAAVGAVTLAVATGVPPVYDLVVKLPGFDAANNGRFAVIAVLCLAVLAGWGLDELTADGSRRARVVLGSAVVLFVLPAVIAIADREFGRDALGDALRVAWGFADADAGAASVIKLAALLDWLVVAAAALVLLALRVRGRLGVGAFVALALALTTFDLFKAGMGYNPAIPQSHAVQPATPAVRYLQERSPQRFSALQVTSALSLVYPFVPNTAMRYGVQDVRGYVIPTEERYFDLWRDVIHRKDGCYYLFCTQAPPADDRSYRALALLGVGNLLQHPQDPPLAGQRPAYEGADARIYRNPAALPRAFLVDRQQVVDGAKAARNTVTAAGFPARSVAVTEQRIAGIPEGTATSSPGAANIADYTAERVAVDTRSNRRSLLVLTDNWYPGWKAKVDGHDAPVERVDYLIRGVTVPAGAHRVEFRYDPASWRAGWIVSLLALVAVGAAAAIGWRRRRAEPRHRGATTGMFEA